MAERDAIQNFGYLWDRERVFWGLRGAGNTGTLVGWHRNYGLVNFREQKGIHTLHTEELKVVYVGQVGAGDQGLQARLKQHKDSRALWNRWRFFSWYGTRRVNPGGRQLAAHAEDSPQIGGKLPDFLNQLEAIVIQFVEPPLNKQGPSWGDAVQFDQRDDENLHRSDLPSIAEQLSEISERLVTIERHISNKNWNLPGEISLK
jgi:hypothetical protein